MSDASYRKRKRLKYTLIMHFNVVLNDHDDGDYIYVYIYVYRENSSKMYIIESRERIMYNSRFESLKSNTQKRKNFFLTATHTRDPMEKVKKAENEKQWRKKRIIFVIFLTRFYRMNASCCEGVLSLDGS